MDNVVVRVDKKERLVISKELRVELGIEECVDSLQC